MGLNSEHWIVAGSIEHRRLIAKTKTMHPIHHHVLPSDRRGDVIYYNPITREKLINSRRTFRVRGVAGGDRINYTGIVSSSTASLQLVKVLLHSDIDDFSLLSTLHCSEYVRISVAVLPDDIREEFQLDQYIHNDYVLFEITKGMYGLPQAGYLAQKEVVEHLSKFDYHPAPSDPCLLRHKTNGVAFTLVVDDFLVKYKDRKAATHLLSALQERYPLKFDWSPTQYLGIDISFS